MYSYNANTATKWPSSPYFTGKERRRDAGKDPTDLGVLGVADVVIAKRLRLG